MNKSEYLNELRKYLKRVPKQDLDDALEYYEEYFEEAGAENEQKVIDELGTPKELAKRIIIECVDKNFSDDYESQEISNEVATSDDKNKKKNLSPWLVLAAVFALPLSPIILALIIVALVVMFAMVIALISLFVSFGAMTIAGLFTAIIGIIVLFVNPTGGLLMFGISLAIAAIGSILFCLVFTLFDLLIKVLSKSGSKLVHKKAGEKA